MPAPPPFWSWLLPLAAGIAVAACSTAPALPRQLAIQPGERVAVQLLLTSDNLRLVLWNNSAVSALQGNRQVGAKVVDDADLQALLDILGEKGMFQRGDDSPLASALDVLTVEAAGKRWHWSRYQTGVQAAEAAFHEARAYFLTLYNSTESWHNPSAARTGGERPSFAAEQERVRRDAATARARLERARRQQ
jgi:hypothetical protein